ncbi:mitogen-activated protein kinase kinase kinase ANP1 isoform X2 [Rosa rugosa]|uniref:mitogen-activated protein kinase kinase kinase ANP1 isoform X1 n=1 Tax=Rosa rugosa TaxID=74645 RepID=UPI002B40640C|nr:mitogen-activated protein kinase kinase kinase ANP1 isoform X1 [Rosa rugosa]XP_062006213.1 mitogen-activated protein kinase kinase kinase ANP1 isoform X2 [Rosa rugosa]
MQDIFGSVRRSLVFRPPPPDTDDSPVTLVDKITSSIRKSRVFSKPSPPPPPKDAAPPIRWRKGELIGCGAFGRVYMGMNLGSGELLAVKQVLIAVNSASKEKAQAHIKELEEEVKLLKNLSHPNIVRYLGTVREEETLNILLEFVPGGSISSLLGKFGSFPEAVMRTYTKQLLLGLEYLHKNGIMHRDIKGANILVDNKGCIKLADFGASKQVVELATISGAKSMKGTPYWMAPEVIRQTGHSFSADIWSVGCTVIEMATGKPPWSEQYQEVAALFHIGTTKSHPPIPEHISFEAKDFLLKCLQKEPNLRPTASELLQHPFVTGQPVDSHPVLRPSIMEDSEIPAPSYSSNLQTFEMSTCRDSSDMCNMGSLHCSVINPDKVLESTHIWGRDSDDDMCQIDDKDDVMVGEVNLNSSYMPDELKSFNPMCEPTDEMRCQLHGSSETEQNGMDLDTSHQTDFPVGCSGTMGAGEKDFSFPCGPSLSEDDDELTESKITAFLDEKALELKKLQTPLYEEFYNSMNVVCSPSFMDSSPDETTSKYLKLPPKSRSPKRSPIGTPSAVADALSTVSPGSSGRRVSNIGNASDQNSKDMSSPPHTDWKGLGVDAQQEPGSPSMSFSERQRKWKEELDQELERKREMMRQAGVGKTSSPKDRALNRQRERTRFASPGK